MGEYGLFLATCRFSKSALLFAITHEYILVDMLLVLNIWDGKEEGMAQFPYGSSRRIEFSQIFCFLHCVCRLCINYQDLCASLLGIAALRILLLTFISLFLRSYN